MWQNKSRRHPCECPLQKEAGLQTKKSADPQKKNYEDIILLLFLIDLMLYCYFRHSVFGQVEYPCAWFPDRLFFVGVVYPHVIGNVI